MVSTNFLKSGLSDFVIIIVCRPQTSSALFFEYNTQLGPPYHVIMDTNFINFAIQNKLDIYQSMMDCLYAKCKLFSISNFSVLLTTAKGVMKHGY